MKNAKIPDDKNPLFPNMMETEARLEMGNLISRFEKHEITSGYLYQRLRYTLAHVSRSTLIDIVGTYCFRKDVVE